MQIIKPIEVGVDVIQPFNKNPGSMQRTTVAGTINYTPFPYLKLSTGFVGGGIVNLDIPLGVSFSFTPQQAWQLSLGTNDIVSLIKQNKPTIALSVSLFRYRM